MASADEATEKLREHLLELLGPGGAHVGFDQAVKGLPTKLRGAKPPAAKPSGVPHTPWRLVEHMRITQEDILEFTRDTRHKSPPWPQGYWPEGDASPDGRAWNESIAKFRADRKAMIDLVKDRTPDLLSPLPHGQGQTIAREVMLLADHTAYHLGQLILLRRALGAWEG